MQGHASNPGGTQGQGGPEAMGRYYRSAWERSQQREEERRRRREARLAEETGWGRLNAEMEGGRVPPPYGASQYDPSVYDPSQYTRSDWGHWEGPDRRYVTLDRRGPGHPHPTHDQHGRPIHVVSTEPYFPGTYFGGGGAWGHGGI